MAVYRVRNKWFYRSGESKNVVKMDGTGNRIVVLESGPTQRFEAGTLMYDVQDSELTAFPDRFELVSDEEAPPAPYLAAAAAPTTPQLNPELFSLLRRDRAGQTTADEQAVVAELVTYMEQFAKGIATPEETEAIAALLKEFDVPLFA